MRSFLLAVFLGATLFSVTVCAEEYEINVVQKGGNLFWEAEQELFIQTEYCFVDVGTTQARLQMESESGILIFSEKSRCAIKGLFGKSELAEGTYTLDVTREDDNWYVIDGKNAALNTENCLAAADGSRATLTIDAAGGGVMSVENEECSIAGIYSQAQLEQ